MISHYLKEIEEGLASMVVTHKREVISFDEGVSLWIEHAHKTCQRQGLLFFCGNGASATMAEHMSHDWFQNAKVNTYSVSETSHLTAIGNDLSFEDIFAYRIRRTLTDKDMLITISSSGNSADIVKAINKAKEKGAFVITFSGMGANNCSRELGDLNFYVPLSTYGLVESAHAVILHEILDAYLDRYEGGRH